MDNTVFKEMDFKGQQCLFWENVRSRLSLGYANDRPKPLVGDGILDRTYACLQIVTWACKTRFPP